MLLSDIKHRGTISCISTLQIDIEPFKDLAELKEYINKNRQKLYRKVNAKYFRDYMRERYRDKNGVPGKKNPRTTTPVVINSVDTSCHLQK